MFQLIKKFGVITQFKNNLFYCSTAIQSNAVSKDKLVKVLTLEIDVMRHEGRKVPDPVHLKPQHWEQILALNSKSARQKYYTFLWKTEKKRENAVFKKDKQREVIKERLLDLIEKNKTDNHIIYGLMHNTYFLRIVESTMNLWNNNKLINAIQFGPKLIYDCSYDKRMSSREAMNAAKQLMLVFAENRMHDKPFDLHFCSVYNEGTTMHYLRKHIPTLDEPWFPLNIHEKCFTEVFPKEKLVYLTPHTRNELDSFNHDDIYIVGAMVDKINNEPLSLAKAKQLGLRMAKLPLERYLQWGAGSGKSLTLNQMTSILLEQKESQNWNKSLQVVPRRKIVSDRKNFHNINNVDENLAKYKFDFKKFRKL